ncbi:MAG: hypothetical protein R3Y62_08395, partial [Eubacteriales bacterium]
MKTITTVATAALLVVALSASVFAAQGKTREQSHPQNAMQSEKMAEMETLAEEAGLTLEEYMDSLKPEQGEKRTSMEREEPSEEMMAQMEEKKAEMDDMKAEKMAEMEALAEEAGLT